MRYEKGTIMFCSNCGKEIADNANFCEHCGSTIKRTVEEQPIIGETVTNTNTGPGKKRNSKILVWTVVATIAVVAIGVFACVKSGVFSPDTSSESSEDSIASTVEDSVDSIKDAIVTNSDSSKSVAYVTENSLEIIKDVTASDIETVTLSDYASIESVGFDEQGRYFYWIDEDEYDSSNNNLMRVDMSSLDREDYLNSDLSEMVDTNVSMGANVEPLSDGRVIYVRENDLCI